MALINLNNIQLGFGGPLLLNGVNLSIERGERICLIGRNGEGKSTLMKLMAGDLKADDGEIVCQDGCRITRLTQEVPAGLEGTVFNIVAAGLGELGELVTRYHEVITQLATDCSDTLLSKLERIQHQLEAADGWQSEQQVEKVISRLSLDPDMEFSALSGGLKRRVLLAQALVLEPDLLLLDEPTNHLDIESIRWLEEFLIGYRGSLLFITHDRAFLRNLATRIIELDRGSLTDWPGDYDNFLRRKEERLNAETLENARFDKKLAQEEVWIRQGIKARRTRNEGRVRALKDMREERSQRRNQSGKVNMVLQAGERSGKLVVEAKNVSYGWDDKLVVRNFTTTIMRGDRIGLIGPNGAGKSTLLNLLLGRIEPDSGTIKLGTKMEVVYFDQMRGQLDESMSVQDNVGEGSDKVEINGRSKHIISYLQDFLFTPERARSPIKALSGGERNRLLLAKLFTKPANILVMDEPTNDLDVETLELLEELLLSFEGTLLLVSHDRYFLDNVVTSCLVFEDDQINEYVGGYGDWQKYKQLEKSSKSATAAKSKSKSTPKLAKAKGAKLSYKDQRALDALPAKIDALEQEQADLEKKMADPAIYQQDQQQVDQLNQRFEQVNKELEDAFEKWEKLEEQRNQLES
ncbi:MAG: ATP-binding cassette domain-containing protein [Candidatus Polarisedimenticolaceae bacterium]|nr:ATP-binding cassette domain-containing protein [Candidatus Polarisedimenticolaceae bacterium]